MGVTVDNSDFRRFAAQILESVDATEKGVGRVVQRGAMNIKKQMNADLAASKHFKGAAGSVTYDIRSSAAFGGGAVEAEIGPDKNRKGGPLGNIAYFGTSRGGGTVPDPSVALNAEEPRFEKALADLMGKGL